MHYITSMARISWAKSILTHFFLFDSNLTGFFFFAALLLNLPKSLVPVVTHMKRDTGIFFNHRQACTSDMLIFLLSAPVRARRPPGIRIVVSGISRDTSWQV
jgi:hypothetical protein